jgi:cardiolipin synthase
MEQVEQGKEAHIPIFDGEVAGHRLVLHADGPARFAQMLAMIEGARESLRLFYYIVSDDDYGQAIREALIDARNRGVAVTLLLDGFGSQGLAEPFLDSLKEAGARIDRFLPTFGRRYLLRNHQKMLIADGARALVGGANLAGEYFAARARGGVWHDLMLMVEGESVKRLAAYFDALDHWVANDRMGIRTLQRILAAHSDVRGPVRWLMGGPFQRLSPFARALRADLDRALLVDMVQAYFAPDFSFLRRLGRVAQRGRVRLITAARSDNITTIAAARHCYPRLLKRHAQIYEYQLAKLHMKLIVADDAVYIGSANYDVRSLFINVELMLRIEDHDFAQAMRAFCVGQHAQAQPIDAAWLQRVSGPFRRLRWLIAYFLVTTVDYTITRRVNIGPNRRRWIGK